VILLCTKVNKTSKNSKDFIIVRVKNGIDDIINGPNIHHESNDNMHLVKLHSQLHHSSLVVAAISGLQFE